MDIIDTHAHLDHPQLLGNIDAVLDQARQAKVARIVCVGCTLESSRRAVALAERHASVFAAVGIHPNDANDAHQDDWQPLRQLMEHPRVVAVGETGLDRHWDDTPWEVQLESFRWHWQASHQSGLPMIIHLRDGETEMLEYLEQAAGRYGTLSGVLHSFTGSLATAQRAIQLGLHIGLAGMLTFKNAANLREVARQLPLDRLVVETDAPYLTPEPHRGERPNHPAHVLHTLECLAKLHGVSTDQMAAHTTANAERLFPKLSTANRPQHQETSPRIG
jgi:TatD DNase family protein